MSTIVSGIVGPDGAIVSGEAFNAERIDQGKYQITFDMPFPGRPAVILRGT